MASFILVVFVLYVLITFPHIGLVAGLILAGLYFCDKYKIVERDEKSSEEDTDIVDDMEGWSAKKAAEEEIEAKLNKDVTESEEFKAEAAKMNAFLKEKQRINDEKWEKELVEAENRGGKTIEHQKATTKQPRSQSTSKQTMSDEEIFASMDELKHGSGPISDDFTS